MEEGLSKKRYLHIILKLNNTYLCPLFEHIQPMKLTKLSLLILSALFLFHSCIQDEALNPEADIIALVFPDNSLRDKEPTINNDNVIVYPRENVNLRDSTFSIEVSDGATWEKIGHNGDDEVLFYISVTSESGEYNKLYPIVQVEDFPYQFTFEDWDTPSKVYKYENPREGSLLWYSSNNGAAIAWNSPSKPADEYLIRRADRGNNNTAVELRTMIGPGKIAGGIQYIPCLAGSLYLGGFNALTGLLNPLRSTTFGVPYSNGKPLSFSGEYSFKRGTEDYINSDGTTDNSKDDMCSIYAVIFKTDKEVQFLYGDNIADSPNVIARAQLNPADIVEGSELISFEVNFDYDSYTMPFHWNELLNDEYKITIVCTSSSRGQHYEGRPGNTLIVDNLRIHYDLNE
jgi:hypothetical protein